MKQEKIGQVIKDIRRQRFLTQMQLAKLAKLSPVTICEVESGKKDPTYKTLKKIASVLKAKILFSAIEDKAA